MCAAFLILLGAQCFWFPEPGVYPEACRYLYFANTEDKDEFLERYDIRKEDHALYDLKTGNLVSFSVRTKQGADY